MTAPDHADVIREALRLAKRAAAEYAVLGWRVHDLYAADAHLDALVAERDEALTEVRVLGDAREVAKAQWERAEAAEADVATLGERYVEAGKRQLAAEAERDAALRLVNGYRQADKTIARAEAAEAEVARLRERYDEAVAHLYGIVEADKQDAQMGHPNPGDSCIGVYIGLVLMEWLETRAALVKEDTDE